MRSVEEKKGLYRDGSAKPNSEVGRGLNFGFALAGGIRWNRLETKLHGVATLDPMIWPIKLVDFAVRSSMEFGYGWPRRANLSNRWSSDPSEAQVLSLGLTLSKYGLR